MSQFWGTYTCVHTTKYTCPRPVPPIAFCSNFMQTHELVSQIGDIRSFAAPASVRPVTPLAFIADYTCLRSVTPIAFYSSCVQTRMRVTDLSHPPFLHPHTARQQGHVGVNSKCINKVHVSQTCDTCSVASYMCHRSVTPTTYAPKLYAQPCGTYTCFEETPRHVGVMQQVR